MATDLSDTQRALLGEIQHGLPISATPYKDVASKIGISVEQVLDILNDWKKQGRLRRVGAIVNHFKVGVKAGAMVVWKVDEDRVEEIGNLFASFGEVSHAYERPLTVQWLYNIYTMVHGSDQKSVAATVRKMSEKSGINDYKQLETIKELKKIPPTYILKKGSR